MKTDRMPRSCPFKVIMVNGGFVGGDCIEDRCAIYNAFQQNCAILVASWGKDDYLIHYSRLSPLCGGQKRT